MWALQKDELFNALLISLKLEIELVSILTSCETLPEALVVILSDLQTRDVNVCVPVVRHLAVARAAHQTGVVEALRMRCQY